MSINLPWNQPVYKKRARKKAKKKAKTKPKPKPVKKKAKKKVVQRAVRKKAKKKAVRKKPRRSTAKKAPPEKVPVRKPPTGKIKKGQQLFGGKVDDFATIKGELVVAVLVPPGHELAGDWRKPGVVMFRGKSPATLKPVPIGGAKDLDLARHRGWDDGPPDLLEIPAGYSFSRGHRWGTNHYWSKHSGGGHNFRPGFKFKLGSKLTPWNLDTRIPARVSRCPKKAKAEKERKALAKFLGMPASSSWKKLAGSRYPGKGLQGEKQPHKRWEELKDHWKERIMRYLTGKEAPWAFKIGRKVFGAATLDEIACNLTAGNVRGKAADDTAIHYALWELVKEGELQHTTQAPVWFTPRRLA